MPRFFFDFCDGNRQTRDQEGLELENAERAKQEAMVALVQVLQFEESDDDRRSVECRVRDGVQGEIYNVSLTYNGRWASNKDQYRKLEQVRRIV